MKLFRRGDLNAFWALFADNLANMVIITGVCKGLFKMKDEVVFGRILPGLAVALIVGLAFYAYLAIKLAREEKRNDVTALPYGISTPVMFVYLFGIIGPVYGLTKDGTVAWQVGLAAGFIGGLIEALGSITGPIIKKYTPRAGMLGTLAGIAIVWISTVPLAMIFEKPYIGFVSFVILFAGLVAGIKFPFRLPAGLVAIIAGSIIGFFTGDAKISTEGMDFYFPVPVVGDLIKGFKLLFKHSEFIAIILPIEIYNFIETMNNVESAEAAGDKYNVRVCQIMDGVGTMSGAIFGSPFPTTVYIGHPAYKRLGAGAGYALMVGIVFLIGNLFGMVAFLHHLIPHAAVAPILVFIGVVIIAQAFRATKPRYAIAVGMAIIPHIADIIVKKTSATISAVKEVITSYIPSATLTEIEKALSLPDSEKFVKALTENQGFHILGQTALSQGAIITGLLWGAITAFLIDFKFLNASLFSFIAAILTLFGFIHSPRISLHFSNLFIAYAVMGFLFLLFYLLKLKKDPEIEHFKYIEE